MGWFDTESRPDTAAHRMFFLPNLSVVGIDGALRALLYEQGAVRCHSCHICDLSKYIVDMLQVSRRILCVVCWKVLCISTCRYPLIRYPQGARC